MENYIERHAGKLAYLVPISWAAGLDFLFPFVLLFLIQLRFARPIAEEIVVLLLGVWLVLGITFSSVTELSRVVAAYYSVALLFALVATSNVARSYFANVNLDVLFSAVRLGFGRLFLFCAIFILLGLIIGFGFGSMNFSFPTLLGLIFPFDLPGIADRSTVAEVIRPDWGFGVFAMPRPLTFSPWYTAGAVTMFIAGLFYLMSKIYFRSRVWSEILLEFAIFVLLFFSLSRTTLGMYVVGFGLAAILFGDPVRTKITIIVGLVAVVGVSFIGAGMELAEFRSYSTATRFEAYSLGIEYATDRSLLFGLGYKPHVDDLHIPIGSHSSIVSFIVRGGVPAVVLFFIAFYALPLLRWGSSYGTILAKDLRTRKIFQIGFRFQILIWGWLPFQEIDTAAVASTLIFLSYSLIFQLMSRLRSDF